MVASGVGHIGIVKMLLESGARRNDKAREGITALTIAENNGHHEIMKLLRTPQGQIAKTTPEELEAEDQRMFIERLRGRMRTTCTICLKEKFRYECEHLPVEVVTGMRGLTQGERENYAALCSACGSAVCGVCLPSLPKGEGTRTCNKCGENGFPIRLKALPQN